MNSKMQMPELSDQLPGSFDLRRLISLLWHWAWLIAVATLLAAGTAYLVSSLMTPIYQAKTVVLVNEAPSNKSIDVSTLELSSQLTQTYSQMMTKSTILNEVAKRLGLVEIDPKNVDVQPVTNTQLITISVESTDPGMAPSIANTLVAVFSDTIQSLQNERFASSEQSLQSQMSDIEQQIQAANTNLAQTTDPAEKDRLETNLTNYQQIYSSLLQSYEQVRLTATQTVSSITQIEPATTPEFPVRPRTLLNVVLSGLVGLLLSAGLVIGVDMLDDTLKTPEEITQKLGLPILGIIGHIEKEGWPVTADQPRSPISEAFRTLRTNVQFAGAGSDKPLKTILVTSPLPTNGKTTVILNLGVVLAQAGGRVILVDADLRRPAIHRYLQLDNQMGLSKLFVQPVSSMNGAVQESWVKNLSVVTSGNLPPNPSELLGSQKMASILQQLKARSDIVLIDTAPALAVTDAAVMIPFVDGVLLVIKPGTIHLEQAVRLVEEMRRMGANILGVVVNDVNFHHPHYRYYDYHRYHYNYSSNDGGKSKPSKKEKSQSVPPQDI